MNNTGSINQTLRRQLGILTEIAEANTAQLGAGRMAPPWSADGWVEISTLLKTRTPRDYDRLIARKNVELREPEAVTGWQVRLTSTGKLVMLHLERRFDRRDRSGRIGRGEAMDRQPLPVVPEEAVRQSRASGQAQEAGPSKAAGQRR